MHHFYRNPTMPPPHVVQALRSGVRRRPRRIIRPFPFIEVELLSDDEVDELRRQAKENSAYFRKAFAHLRPKPAAKQPPTGQ